MREAHQRRDPSTYRGGGGDPELLSAVRRKYWENKSPEERQMQLATFIAAGQKNNKKNRKTYIESVVRDLLSQLGVTFEQNQQLGRYNVDFLVGNTIIECFGDFWHCNPDLYPPSYYNASLHMTAEEKWDKDTRRKEALESRGYRFFSFWESDIRQRPEEVRTRLTDIFELIP
jgi:very-short-patch-repair endonuclease